MERSGLNVKETEWRCKRSECSHTMTTKPRKSDLAELRSLWRPKPHNDVHFVWHAFMKKFMKTTPSTPFKMVGYPLMVAVERWAKKYPRDVELVRCDDSYHMGSTLVLIHHRARSGKAYMGTSIIGIPQMGAEPLKLFLYPDHTDGLLAVLKSMKKRFAKLWDQF